MSSAALFDDEASLGDHDRARVSAARSCALRALSAYDPPLCDAREEDVVMVAHANNYVFRVDLRAAAAAAAAAATDTEGAVEQAGAPDFVAVRVSGDASVRGEGEVKAEMAWLAAIARDAPLPDGVRVVTPHAASDGRLVVAAPWKPSADAGAEDAAAAAAAAGTGSAVRYCVVFDWMEGVAFRVDVPVPRVFAVGALMAHLHNHADAIAAAGGIPSQDALPRLNSLWLFSPPPALRAAGSEAGAAEGTGVELPAELVDAAARAAAAAQSSMSALWEEGGSAAERLIHADLHFGNVLVKRGDEALQLIDFDDCLRGLPIQDLGSTCCALRSRLWPSIAHLPLFPVSFSVLSAV